ncbi:MAG TPA: chemotaxis response regulator protein-glutamate methylesterase [Candidatus Baltobacteraceae bacterium]|jgi:two-component system chemotaxis response regulator CheB|nr:chemotaxis response regulator protein-glutamate methylesterase [Candidatus Baltobacteraceae bacterium]
MPINVLVVDDSAFMRRAITKMLEGEPEIVVAGTARNGQEAIIKAAQLHPDVITMDVEMPGMGGLDAVREITAQSEVPIIMVSSLTQEGAETTFLALELGAVDFIPKPDSAYVNISDVARDLVAKVRVFSRKRGSKKRLPPPKVSLAPLLPPSPPSARDAFECVAIGTSTGGPVALSHIVPALPGDFPAPIVIVQHMPPGFTRPLADRLNSSSNLTVVEGEEGMVLVKGLVVVAPAGLQMMLRRANSGVFEIELQRDAGRSLHVPSVDVMTASVADAYGPGTLAAILTGMGQDGVVGLRRVKDAGGFVLGQDAATSVVYGMPRAAAQAGLVDRVLPLDLIAPALCELTNTSFARS